MRSNLLETNSWRLIDSGPCDCFYNMALDESIAEHVLKGLAPTTIRFYEWQTKTLSIGAFQKIDDIDITYCKDNQIPIVRRPTGGRAILHLKELTYSVSSINSEVFSNDIINSYLLISRVFVYAFRSLGVDVDFSNKRVKGTELKKSPLCFNAISVGEITLNGKKIIGSAQKRWNNGFLQQGSIQFETDYNTIEKIFHETNKYLSNDICSMTSSIKMSHLKEKIIEGFESYFQVCLSLSDPLEIEHQRALDLVRLKYQTQQWTYRRMVGNYDSKKDGT